MSSNLKDRIQSEIETLQAARDELKVQAHLGALEAREAWEKTEQQWSHLEGHIKRLAEATQESLEDVGTAINILADEIRNGYEHVRELL